jgi:hypothetical protein
MEGMLLKMTNSKTQPAKVKKRLVHVGEADHRQTMNVGESLQCNDANDNVESINFIEQKATDVHRIHIESYPTFIVVCKSITMTLDELNVDSFVTVNVKEACTGKEDVTGFLTIIYKDKNIGSYDLSEYTSLSFIYVNQCKKWFVV